MSTHFPCVHSLHGRELVAYPCAQAFICDRLGSCGAKSLAASGQKLGHQSIQNPKVCAVKGAVDSGTLRTLLDRVENGCRRAFRGMRTVLGGAHQPTDLCAGCVRLRPKLAVNCRFHVLNFHFGIEWCPEFAQGRCRVSHGDVWERVEAKVSDRSSQTGVLPETSKGAMLEQSARSAAVATRIVILHSRQKLPGRMRIPRLPPG